MERPHPAWSADLHVEGTVGWRGVTTTVVDLGHVLVVSSCALLHVTFADRAFWFYLVAQKREAVAVFTACSAVLFAFVEGYFLKDCITWAFETS